MNRDNVDPEYLTTPKAWNAWSIARFMIFMGPTSSVFDICTFVLNWYILHLSFSFIFLLQWLTVRVSRYRYGIQDGNSPEVPRAQTNWFIESAMTQVRLLQPRKSDGPTEFWARRNSSSLFISFERVKYLSSNRVPLSPLSPQPHSSASSLWSCHISPGSTVH